MCPEMVYAGPGVPSPPDTRRVWRGTGVSLPIPSPPSVSPCLRFASTGVARLGVTFNQPLTFFSPLKNPHTGQRVDPSTNLLHLQNGPARVRPNPKTLLKRLDPTTWSKPTSRPSPTRLRGTSPRSVRLVLQRSKSPGSPTGVHWPVLKPVDVERSDLGRVQQTSDNSERRTCLFFRRCPWPEAVHVLMPA